MRPIQLFALAMLVLLSLAGGGNLAPAAAREELRVAVGSFAGGLTDPIHGGVGTSVFQSPMFDFLVTFDRDMEFAPGLAQSWEVSADGLVYTFNLRKDVKWHNGDDFTAHDVVHHFEERLPKGTAPYAGQVRGKIDRIETPDSHTVTFYLKDEWPDFIAHLSPGNTMIGAITPRDYSIKVGDRGFAENPIGTGPYRLVDHKNGSYFLFEAVTNHPFRPEPGFRKLRIMLIPEESTRIAMLRSGDADLIGISPDSIASVRDHGFRVFNIADSFMTYLAFIGVWENRADELARPTRLENVDVRRALSLAIDREAIVKYLFLGEGAPAALFPVFPGGIGWDENWNEANQLPYDPDKAREILQEANIPDDFRIKIYAVPLPGMSWSATLAEVIADYWQKVGLKVELVTTELGAALPIFYGRPDSALGSAFIYRTTRSVFPVGLIENYVVAEGRAQFALVNWDERYRELNNITDVKEREQAFVHFVRDLRETYTLLPLFYINVTYAASPSIDNWDPVKGWPSLGLSLEYLRPNGGKEASSK